MLEFLKSEGQGTRINKLLRNYMDVQLQRVHHK
ncbi:hypothetical protein [Catenovulum sediminis]|uniref:Uncharacterized protein n=1 Tax=Catenovulum sediminis TaxID=1740262 RepID=A0ABV1RLD8_9ALTE